MSGASLPTARMKRYAQRVQRLERLRHVGAARRYYVLTYLHGSAARSVMFHVTGAPPSTMPSQDLLWVAIGLSREEPVVFVSIVEITAQTYEYACAHRDVSTRPWQFPMLPLQ